MNLSIADLDRYVDVAAVDDIPAGEGRRYLIDGQAIAMFHVGDTFYAIGDTCTHEEYSLSEGCVCDHTVECLKHGARFDLMTGEVLSLPATASVDSFALGVRDRRIYVDRRARDHREALTNVAPTAPEGIGEPAATI
jgi:3-phenylpropionate/trans-cinnamate dioxygenase ferredoxin component